MEVINTATYIQAGFYLCTCVFRKYKSLPIPPVHNSDPKYRQYDHQKQRGNHTSHDQGPNGRHRDCICMDEECTEEGYAGFAIKANATNFSGSLANSVHRPTICLTVFTLTLNSADT